MEGQDLHTLDKEALINIIQGLSEEVKTLNNDFKKLTNLRLYYLERSHIYNMVGEIQWKLLEYQKNSRKKGYALHVRLRF